MLPSEENLKGYLTRTLGPLVIALMTATSGCAPTEADVHPPPAIVEPEKPSQETLNQINQGFILKTAEDEKMLNDTYPGIDLTYFNNLTVAKIRSIPDRRLRVMTAIGYLNVEKSRRYNRSDGVYTCNIYALDLLRLILGNEAIGSRYDILSGEPMVFGINDIDWNNKERLSGLIVDIFFLIQTTLYHGWKNMGLKDTAGRKLMILKN